MEVFPNCNDPVILPPHLGPGPAMHSYIIIINDPNPGIKVMLMSLANGTCLERAMSALEARIQSQNDLNKMEKGLEIRRVQVHADKSDMIHDSVR